MTDFHKLVITVMKNTFENKKPKEIFYRSKKSSTNDDFRKDLNEALQINNPTSYESFEKQFLNTLNHHIPLKKR